VMEYIGAREYDAVIMMINPSVFEDAHYKNLGV